MFDMLHLHTHHTTLTPSYQHTNINEQQCRAVLAIASECSAPSSLCGSVFDWQRFDCDECSADSEHNRRCNQRFTAQLHRCQVHSSRCVVPIQVTHSSQCVIHHRPRYDSFHDWDESGSGRLECVDGGRQVAAASQCHQPAAVHSNRQQNATHSIGDGRHGRDGLAVDSDMRGHRPLHLRTRRVDAGSIDWKHRLLSSLVHSGRRSSGSGDAERRSAEINGGETRQTTGRLQLTDCQSSGQRKCRAHRSERECHSKR